MWFVYLIETDNNTIYTGISTDIERRFAEHCDTFAGKRGAKGAKYFRRHKPLRIVYHESFDNRADASRRERTIKKLARSEKLDLIDSGPTAT